MSKNATVIPYIFLMVAIIVAVDVVFFRHQFWPRLIANIVIVLVFASVYFLFLRHL